MWPEVFIYLQEGEEMYFFFHYPFPLRETLKKGIYPFWH